jgi:AraC-like DNA-binding protein
MFYKLDFSNLPDITSIYSVKRRTVWKIVDTDTLLIYVSEGCCTITSENRSHTLKAGSLFIVPSKQYYIRRPIGDEFCTLYYAHIRFQKDPVLLDYNEACEFIASRRKERTRMMFGNPREAEISHTYVLSEHTELSSSAAEITELYNKAISESLVNHAESPTLISLFILKLLLIAASHVSDVLGESDLNDISPPDTYRKLRKVISYIRLHVKEDISLDDLCFVCNFSKQHLIRVFREEFGTTPKAYILEYRINRAKELFYRNPHLSVKEVADEMGFSDQHYFTRLFTKVAGLTPSAYKKHLLTFDPSKQ